MGLTPFRIEDAQCATPSSLITAHKVGVLNEKRCKRSEASLDSASLMPFTHNPTIEKNAFFHLQLAKV